MPIGSRVWMSKCVGETWQLWHDFVMRNSRNGKEGCFPGEGIVKDDGFVLERLVNYWEQGKMALVPSYGIIITRGSMNVGEKHPFQGKKTMCEPNNYINV